jgi:hypothetical protein
VLRGRCACNAVAYEVSDEFVVAFNCHCSNCRALTGAPFLPWGEIEPETMTVTKGADSLLVVGDFGTNNSAARLASFQITATTATPALRSVL